MKKGAVVTRSQIIDHGMKSLKMLAYANRNLNMARREMLRPSLYTKYQRICNNEQLGANASGLLFGPDFGRQMRDIDDAHKLGQKIQRQQAPAQQQQQQHTQRFQPYPQSYPAPYGQKGYQQKAPTRGFKAQRSRAFLGENPRAQMLIASRKSTVVNHEINFQENVVDHTCVDFQAKYHCNVDYNHDLFVVSRRTTAPRGTLESTRVEMKLEGTVNDNTLTTAQKQVGEYPSWFKRFVNKCVNAKMYAGNISRNWSSWKRITNDWTILNMVQGMTINFTDLPLTTGNTANSMLRIKHKERVALEHEISVLKQKKVIEITTNSEGEFISPIFLVEKRDSGKFRVILNLKKLNDFVEYKHFKMDTLASALKLMGPNCFMASLDLTDAYYSININRDHRKFLRFSLNGTLYQYTCLPNGLSSGPRDFTKLLKIPFAHLRKYKGHSSIAYIDDTLLVGPTREAVRQAVMGTWELLVDLGFTINQTKSIIEPTKTIEFLGFILDSENMTSSLSGHKADSIILHCKNLRSMSSPTIREVARVLGKLMATVQGVKFARLYTRYIEIDKNYALTDNAHDYEAHMTLSRESIEELGWWINNSRYEYRPITETSPDYTIFTDASKLGWGCFDPQTGISQGGQWTDTEKIAHINELELMAAWYGLKCLCLTLSDCHVKLMTDNTTTMVCINKQGSARSRRCNRIARLIWFWCIERDIWISSAHCPGIYNIEADEASRKFNDVTEWKLNPAIFRTIASFSPKFDRDMFASRINYQLMPYCSWKPDPESDVVDAFSINWKDINFYGFPPFSLIARTIRKVLDDRVEMATLIVPNWPSQVWFGLLAEILIEWPRSFDVEMGTLYLPQDLLKGHPFMGKMTLLAIKCSGNGMTVQASQEALLKQCSMRGGPPLTNNTRSTYDGGPSIVLRGGSIPIKQLF